MGDVHYMISESAKRVGVESHVLRYWEEELELPIGRTEMGHRHYTEDDIQLFSCIKELKDQGMLLKEIKEILPDMLRTRELLREKHRSMQRKQNFSSSDAKDKPVPVSLGEEELRTLFRTVMQQLLLDNNKLLEEVICKSVTEKVAKDMGFLLQARERQEEDRYRRLDHLIRQQQTYRKEASRSLPGRYIHRILTEV